MHGLCGLWAKNMPEAAARCPAREKEGAGMRERNVPIQMIAHCDADGSMQPLRFRFEDRDHMLHTVQIVQVLDSRRVEYVGIEAFIYLCKAVLHGEERLFELKYTVRTHRWVLFQEIR